MVRRAAERRARLTVLALIGTAIGLHATTAALAESGQPRFLVELFAASCAPYVVVGLVAVIARWERWLWPGFAAMLAADAAAFLSVFVWPTDAQAPLILLFMPFWNSILVLPGALLVTVGIRWLQRRRTRGSTSVQRGSR